MKSSPVEWQGIDAPCPHWEHFVTEIMGDDPEMASFLQRVFGYGVTGLAREHIFLVLFGRGRNGKGIMTEVIQTVLGGQNATTALAGPVQSEMLLDQGKNRSAAGPSPDIMSLRGLRIAFASETDEGQRFSPARVKWFSGGETLTGRYPHDKRNVTFRAHPPAGPADQPQAPCSGQRLCLLGAPAAGGLPPVLSVQLVFLLGLYQTCHPDTRQRQVVLLKLRRAPGIRLAAQAVSLLKKLHHSH